MRLDKKEFDKWVNWIEMIRKDLTQMINDKQIYTGFIETVRNNMDHIERNKGKLFCSFVRRSYAIQTAVGVRRHIRINDDSISLMRLLEQMKKCASQFTFDFYLGCYSDVKDKENLLKLTFKNFSKDGKIISESIIDDDINELKGIGNKVGNIVDKVYAHLDKRGSNEEVTYDELSELLVSFDKITCKYLALLTFKGYHTIKPTIQYNWEKIFSVPLDIRKTERYEVFIHKDQEIKTSHKRRKLIEY